MHISLRTVATLVFAAATLVTASPLGGTSLTERQQCLSEGADCFGTFLSCCECLRCQFIGAVNTGVSAIAATILNELSMFP